MIDNWVIFTGDALVSCLEVRGELSKTWSGAKQVAVWYKDVTRCFAGARSVGVVQHVGVAAKQVRVRLQRFLQSRRTWTCVDTSANAHASESRRCHDDDITMTTAGTERLQLTVLAYSSVCVGQQNVNCHISTLTMIINRHTECLFV